MPNIVDITYEQTGNSTKTNSMGMREMQERVYSVKDEQYILLKAPPASGKSRALMFVALDKLHNQGIKKAIIAVPEKVIANSFQRTDLASDGFFTNWEPNPVFNLCTSGGDKKKVESFINFMNSNEQILICTHSTLRYSFAIFPMIFLIKPFLQ